MVELREQLGALLCLEAAYETRDYLEDVTARGKSCDSSTSRNGNCESCSLFTGLQERVVSLGEGRKINDDESLSSNTEASTFGSSTVVTEQRAVSWREKICEWAYQANGCILSHKCHARNPFALSFIHCLIHITNDTSVADHFDLTRDLVYITLHYMDRVCTVSDTADLLRDKNRFQLLAMASLCLAIKLHGGMDTHAPGIESSIVETILHLGRGQFSAEELKAMEVDALQQMQWRLNPPTPQTFISYLLELFPLEEKSNISDIALYTIELSVHDYYLIPYKPSVLALAALSNAAQMLGHSDAWITGITDDLIHRDGYKETKHIDACSDRLHSLFTNTGTKLEDFVDVSSLANSNHLDGICQERSPTSVIH